MPWTLYEIPYMKSLDNLYEKIDQPSFHEDIARTTSAAPKDDIGTDKNIVISDSFEMIISGDDDDFSDTNLVLSGNEPEHTAVNLSLGDRVRVQWPDDGQRYAG